MNIYEAANKINTDNYKTLGVKRSNWKEKEYIFFTLYPYCLGYYYNNGDIRDYKAPADDFTANDWELIEYKLDEIL